MIVVFHFLCECLLTTLGRGIWSPCKCTNNVLCTAGVPHTPAATISGATLSMFELSQIVSLSYYFVICVALRWVYLALTQFWWKDRGSKPELIYQAGSAHVQRVVEGCSTLRER